MATWQPVKGTRDFYPAEMRLRNWLFDIWRETSRGHGFQEYDSCVLESEELYLRKAGEEITEQLYAFPDKSGRRLALRPEMTPSLARLILQRQRSLNFPLKWFSIPQCFRYERMTRGRKREHYQWNLDLVGQSENVAEVEVISALLTSLEKMGLDASHVELRLNDRNILNGLLRQLRVPPESHLPVMVVIDKRDKISAEAMDEMLAEQGLNKTQLAGINRFFAAAAEGLPAVRKRLGSHAGATKGLEELLPLLKTAGFADYVSVDCTVVRGLSYYTGTVFEVRDRTGKFRAVCGGGRYDNLLSAFGGDSIPAIGFGFGDVVILELLAELKLLPDLTDHIDCVVIPFSQKETGAALQIAQQLRRAGHRVDADFTFRKLKRALNRADSLGARHAILLMPDEWSRGEVKVKNMATREEKKMPVGELLAELKPLPHHDLPPE